jgi:hypothetical protein
MLIAGTGFLWVQSVARDQWQRMEKRIAELENDRKVRSAARPVLRGEGIPGNAWEDYAAALGSTPALPRSGAIPLYFGEKWSSPPGSTPPTLAAMEAWAAPAGAALDRFLVGARRAEVRPTLEMDHRFTPLVVEIDLAWRALWNVTRAGIVRAHGLIDRGKSDEAVQVLLDLAQFGRDALQGTSLDGIRIGENVLDQVCLELRKAVNSEQVSPEALERLDRELEILDGGWPNGSEMLHAQLLAFGRGCREEGEQGSLMYQCGRPRVFRSWRWGYSGRFRAASTFLKANAMVREVLQAADAPIADNRAICFHDDGWPDPIIDEAFGPRSSADPGRGQRTLLRLLRVGARFRRSGDVLDLADPCGERLKTSRSGGKLRIWSVGGNGIDDGGVGSGWAYDRDIVLEVKR